MTRLKSLIAFIKHDLWRIRHADLPPRRSFWLRTLRILVLSFSEFDRDRCALRASALTIYTLLSIVPVLAMAFGIAKGFNAEEALERTIRERMSMQASQTREIAADVAETQPTAKNAGNETVGVPAADITEENETDEKTREAAARVAQFAKEQVAMTGRFDPNGRHDLGVVLLFPETTLSEETTATLAADTGMSAQMEIVVDRIIEFANKQLEQTKGGFMAGLSVVFLFWVVIKVLGNIEHSFNDIWGVKRSRSLARKFSDYLAFMLISPFVFILATSMTALATDQIHGLVEELELWGWIGDIFNLLLNLAPLGLFCALLAFTYLFMPNTKVNWKSGVLGGIVAGTLFLISQRIYFAFQIGVSKYVAVYGVFAALPLFLIWLQTSWLIVLYGAEFAFAHRNVDTYEFEPDCGRVSADFKRLMALGALQRSIHAFDHGEKPPSPQEIAEALQAPVRLVNQVLYELVEAQLLCEVRGKEERVSGYQPAVSIEGMTVASVIGQLDARGADNIPIASTGPLNRLGESLRLLRRQAIRSEADVKIKDL